MRFLRVVWLIVRKDLTIEVRSREIAYTTLFFAVSCVLLFAFALVKEGRPPDDAAAAVLWVTVMFSGNLALGRTFERERQSETLRALLLAPAQRPAVYVGKLCGVVALLTITEVMLLPLVAYLFQAPLFRHPVWLAAIVVAGTTGFASVGTLFAAMLVRARSRDMLLPVLLYPITVPVMIAGVRGTAMLLQPEVDFALVRFWAQLLVSFDIVFVTLALWTFEPLMTDEQR
jgi:heme exporter protein CcmB